MALRELKKGSNPLHTFLGITTDALPSQSFSRPWPNGKPAPHGKNGQQDNEQATRLPASSNGYRFSFF
jgi:hypothetical protein|nr:hypothetical protein [Pseudomonas sp.]